MELKYGDNSFSLNLNPKRLLAVISPTLSSFSGDADEIISTALDGCTVIMRAFKPGEKVVIVTSDVTRYTGSELYLPHLVERLNNLGIGDDSIEIIVALGIHRRQAPHEHRKILGSLYGRIRVFDHDCDNQGKLVYLGKTSSGIEVEINRSVVEADRVILTGTIGFHYFAGFGGGRKALMPGVASRRSCMASHLAVLNPLPGSGRNPLADAGNMQGNPVHQAMLEACAMLRPDFILNTVLAPDKQIIAAFAGDWQDAHLTGCRFYQEKFSFHLKEKADLVIVSCGGFPKDINFIQAHKSMDYGCRALKDGGVLVLLAQCRDGYGHATFFNWFRFRDLGEFEVELRKHFEINGQTAHAALRKAQKYRVILVSDLPPEEVATMGMIPASSLDSAVEAAESFLPFDFTAYVIPEGGTVLPVYKV